MTSPDGPLRHRAARDALLAVGVTAVGGLLFTAFDVAERGAPAVNRGEVYELDDLLLTLALALVAALWFAFRRSSESRSQLHALRLSERQRAEYLQRLEDLSNELLLSEAQARQKLAATLHDRVGQPLYAARLRIELAAASTGCAVDEALSEAHALVTEAMAVSKDLSVELSPPILHDLGLREAVRWLLQRLQARYGFEGRFEDGPDWDTVPQHLHEALFASVSELLTNAGKHARARSVSVALARLSDAALAVTVRDDGIGFTPATAGRKGFGLFSIERRLACMDGSLGVHSTPSAGTVAVLSFGVAS
jgi:signal transduction histidine kinase